MICPNELKCNLKKNRIMFRNLPEGTNIVVKDVDGWYSDDFTMNPEQTIAFIHNLIRILNQKYLQGERIPPTHFGNVG